MVKTWSKTRTIKSLGNVSRQSDGMGLLIDGLRKATVTQIYLATEHMRTGTSRSVPRVFLIEANALQMGLAVRRSRQT